MAATLTPVLKPTVSMRNFGVSSSLHEPLKSRRPISAFPLGSIKHAATSSMDSAAGPNALLSVIEVEQLMRLKVKTQFSDLMKAFQTYDVTQTGNVTRGEFRRVIELFCMPMTTPQFNAVMEKVDINKNATVRYRQFLEKFRGVPLVQASSDSGLVRGKAGGGVDSHDSTVRASVPRGWSVGSQQPSSNLSDVSGGSGGCNTAEQILTRLRERVVGSGNPRSLIKALRLFDYNRDGKIQRHELRKVLDNYCCQLSNTQFDKLWQVFDFNNTGLVDYSEFLHFLGVQPSNMKQVPQLKRQVSQLTINMRPTSSTEGQRTNFKCVNLDKLEQEFRKKIRSSNDELEKIFLAFDPTRSGFVSLEDLHSVLSQFIMPMDDNLFRELMERFHFKVTGRIPWLTFLQKFQDPQGLSNGQTIPFIFNHKANPIRGGDQAANLDELLQLLHSHVANSYSSFRSAFLEIDKSRKGRISRAAMRRLLDSFKFQVSAEQFKQLMNFLDPKNSGEISYHRFLKIFEHREGADGHKWLRSVHRYNRLGNPSLPASSVEDLIREKLTLNWRPMTDALKCYDPLGEAFVLPDKLRKVIETYALALDDKHFDNLLSRLQIRDDQDRVNYLEFLDLLKIEASPGDVEGLSEQITQCSQEARMDRVLDHELRMEDMHEHAKVRMQVMSTEEVMVRLQDRLSQHHGAIRDAFKQFTKQSKNANGMTRSELKKMLIRLGITISDEHYAHLCRELDLTGPSARISYPRFVAVFETRGSQGLGGPCFLPESNHRVNPVRGDRWGMDANQLDYKIREKLRSNFSDLRSAFHKFDSSNQGCLRKEDIRQLLNHFMCLTNDDEFDKLCHHLGITDDSEIGYKEFKDLFEVREAGELGHKWLTSVHRFNQLPPDQTLTAEDVMRLLPVKTYAQFQDVSRAFCRTDPQGNGYITKKNFRVMLANLQLPMLPADFKQLWSFYDPAGRNVLTHEAFLRRLGMDRAFTSGDAVGTSSAIIQTSHETLVDHLRGQHDRHEQMTKNQAALATQLPPDEIYNSVKKRIRVDFTDTQTAFRSYDSEKKGFLDGQDLRRLLTDQHLFLDEEQFHCLAARIGILPPDYTLAYPQFCLAFEDQAPGPAASSSHHSSALNGSGPALSSTSSRTASTTVESLTPVQVEAKLKRVVAANVLVLKKAFRAFDRDNTESINVSDFRRILDNFCFHLTDAQFRHVIAKGLSTDDATKVNYNTFFNMFGQAAQPMDCNQWLESMQRRSNQFPQLGRGPGADGPLSLEAVNDRIQEVVMTRPQIFVAAFQELDYANLGVVSKDDFRQILNQHVMRLTDEQFDQICSLLPINEFDNLDYTIFLTKWCRPTDPVPSQAPLTEVHNKKRCEDDPSYKPSAAIFDSKAAADSGSAVERQIRHSISQHWRRIVDRCKQLDSQKRPGYLRVGHFLDILREVGGPDLLPCDLLPMVSRHGLRSNGTFLYHPFLSGFMLANKTGQVETNAAIRKKMLEAGLSFSTDMFPCMARVRGQILTDWKPMLKAFRGLDTGANGLITAGQFRSVLTNTHGVPLTEDEFYQLVSGLDSDKSGKVNYNAVIRVFLKSR